MPKESKRNFEQLNIKQRANLEILLKSRKSLDEIGADIKVSRQTLYRELMRNSYYVSHDSAGCFTSCVNFFKCVESKRRCVAGCENYLCGINCRQLKKYPFVCNYCKKKGHCVHRQRFYDAETASNKYHTKIKEAHSFLRIDDQKFKEIKDLVIPLLKKGHSPEAISMNHPEKNLSQSSIRFWIKNGRLPSCNTSLRLFGRRISKTYDYSKRHDSKRLSELKIGHKYYDYLNYIDNHPNDLIVQFDTVIGNKTGSKSVLTIHIVQYKFQFGILLNKHTAEEVNKHMLELLYKLKVLEDEKSLCCFRRFSKCWIADNGPEFDNFIDLENISKDLHIFFTKAYSSSDKGACEKNHVMVRYIQYKGHSWDDMDQSMIDIIFSHINSYPRKSLNKKTPFDLVLENLGQEFLDAINIKKIDKDDVILNPSLIKKSK